MRDIAVAVLGILGVVVPFAIPVENEDIAWLDERIRRAEEGLKYPFTPENSPDMEAARIEYLQRAYRLRKRLVGDDVT